MEFKLRLERGKSTIVYRVESTKVSDIRVEYEFFKIHESKDISLKMKLIEDSILEGLSNHMAMEYNDFIKHLREHSLETLRGLKITVSVDNPKYTSRVEYKALEHYLDLRWYLGKSNEVTYHHETESLLFFLRIIILSPIMGIKSLLNSPIW